MPRRTLIVTIPPFDGGVPVKAALLARHLRDRGHAVTVAWYATHGHEPDLVAPSWRLHQGARPRTRAAACFGDVDGVAVGCWLPELEVTYYQPSRAWSELLAAHDRHVAVGGNVAVAYRLVRAGLPHFVWCGTPLWEDRVDRHRRMPWPRRLLDRAVTVPLLQRLERRILAETALVLPVSRYSADRFAAMGRTRPIRVLPVPVDEARYTPPAAPAPAGTVGFAGRINDPRKNLPLLFQAVALARCRGADLRLVLTGAPDDTVRRAVAAHGLEAHTRFTGFLDAAALPDFFRGLDVFAMPSFQEGLGIAGVEALACGVPVVSTRNGGAEDYVEPGHTGFLVDFDAAAMADALTRIVADRALRDRLSAGARAVATGRYGLQSWRRQLADAWQLVWNEEP